MHKPKFTIWLVLTLLIGFITVLFVMNIIEPFPDRAQAIVTTEYDTNGQTIDLDSNGKAISNPFATNYVGNTVKLVLGILAVGSDIMLFKASLQKFS